MNGSPKVSLSILMTLRFLLCARLLTQGPANTGGIRGQGDREELIFIEGRDRMQGSLHLGLILYLLGLIFMVMSCFHGQISVQKIEYIFCHDVICTVSSILTMSMEFDKNFSN